jgi:hypothetical protein
MSAHHKISDRARQAVPGRAHQAVRRHLGAGLLEEATVVAALREACSRHLGVDDFTAAEADRTIGNGLDAGRRQPRHVT